MSDHARMGERPLHVCVYLGANPGARPAFAALARSVGRLLAERGHVLVYGGAGVGCMGELATAARAAGGRVVGVIPRVLVEREVAKRDVDDLREVADMHERKATMSSLADAFVALPGGLGTLEELFEMATWSMLGIHRKPVLLFDGDTGYWAPLLALLDHGVGEGFVRPEHRAIFRVAASLDDLAAQLSRG